MDGRIRSLIQPVREAWRRPAYLVLAVLTAAFVLASAAGLRTDLAARDHALQTMLGTLPGTGREVVLATDYTTFVESTTAQNGSAPEPTTPNPAESKQIAAALSAEDKQIADALSAQTQNAYSALLAAAGNVPITPRADAWTSLGTPTFYAARYTTQFEAVYPGEPEIQFNYLEGYAQHARLVAGRWPRTVTTTAAGTFTVEIALSTAALKQSGLHVGSLFLARTPAAIMPPPPITLVVTGAYQPIDPAGAYWQDQSTDIAPQRVRPAPNLPAYLLEDGLLGQDELAALAVQQPFGSSGGTTVQTHVPLETSGLTADQVGGLITGFDTALTQAGSIFQDDYNGIVDTAFHSQMVATLAQFDAEQQAGQLETAMPAVSLALIGLIALLVAARAAVDRTAAESSVQRARGAPLWRLAAAAARDAAVTVLPLTALAVAVAILLPGRSPTGLWNDELVLPLIALAAPAALTALRQRRSHTAASKTTAAATRATAVARRYATQAALVVLCLFGLAQARSGSPAPDSGVDLFTASAPALAAILGALVMLNLGPVLLRAVLHVVSRRGGAVGLLGLARTARTPAPAAVTVAILTLSLATTDLAVALHRTSGKEGAAAAAAQAVYQVADISGTTGFVTPAVFGSDALVAATASYLAVLAVVAVATGCLVVALASAVEARERRAVVGRLTTMGLTANQARAVAVVELLGPIALAAVGGTVAAPPLLWIIRPALAQALGGVDARMSGVTLALPLAAVSVLALASGLVAAAAARRGVAGTLRLGDAAEGA